MMHTAELMTPAVTGFNNVIMQVFSYYWKFGSENSFEGQVNDVQAK